MKIPLSNLMELVSFEQSTQELSHILTMSGFEVEQIIEVPDIPKSILTAVVTSKYKLDACDNLWVYNVNSDKNRQIVSNIQTISLGDVVAVALPSTLLTSPSGKEFVSERMIFNILSDARFVSAFDISIGDIKDLPIIFPRGTKGGIPIKEFYNPKDSILDISITANRGDCLSVMGIAREVYALLSKPEEHSHTWYKSIRKSKYITPFESSFNDLDNKKSDLKLSVDAEKSSPIYLGRIIKDIKVGPSPFWLYARLLSFGLRPINNIVDAVNYAMLECGQPFHAFDLDKISNNQIVVRYAKNGELILCLDGISRKLSPSDLVICDTDKPLCIAGVMGGMDSSVKNETANIFLEAAYFEPLKVRATSKRLGIHSDSSHRFERGIDAGNLQAALDLVTGLILELGGGYVEDTFKHISEDVFNNILKEKLITISPVNISNLLGMNLSSYDIRSHLERLNINSTEITKDFLTVKIPSYRNDITQFADLAEEVARMEGYERVSETLPIVSMKTPTIAPNRILARRLSDKLSSLGLFQVINFTFISKTLLDYVKLPLDDPRRNVVSLLNPISEELSIMRPLLLPSLLKTASHNSRHNSADMKLYEIGKSFLKQESSKMPIEEFHIAALFMGRREDRSWLSRNDMVDIYDVIGVLNNLATSSNIKELSISLDDGESLSCPFYAEGFGWNISVNGSVVGSCGRIHPDIGRNFEIDAPIYFFEVIAHHFDDSKVVRTFKDWSKYPDIERDLAFVLPVEIKASDVLNLIFESSDKTLSKAKIFDVYQGKNIPEGFRSLAISLKFSSVERTLTDSEVQSNIDSISVALSQKYKAELRS